MKFMRNEGSNLCKKLIGRWRRKKSCRLTLREEIAVSAKRRSGESEEEQISKWKMEVKCRRNVKRMKSGKSIRGRKMSKKKNEESLKQAWPPSAWLARQRRATWNHCRRKREGRSGKCLCDVAWRPWNWLYIYRLSYKQKTNKMLNHDMAEQKEREQRDILKENGCVVRILLNANTIIEMKYILKLSDTWWSYD